MNNLSNIIYKELKQYKEEQNTNQNYEYGTVISVKDGVVHAYGLLNVKAGELVEFVDSSVKSLVLNLKKNKQIFFLIILFFLINIYIHATGSAKVVKMVAGFGFNLTNNNNLIGFSALHDNFGNLRLFNYGSKFNNFLLEYGSWFKSDKRHHFIAIDQFDYNGNDLDIHNLLPYMKGVGLGLTTSPFLPKTLLPHMQTNIGIYSSLEKKGVVLNELRYKVNQMQTFENIKNVSINSSNEFISLSKLCDLLVNSELKLNVGGIIYLKNKNDIMSKKIDLITSEPDKFIRDKIKYGSLKNGSGLFHHPLNKSFSTFLNIHRFVLVVSENKNFLELQFYEKNDLSNDAFSEVNYQFQKGNIFFNTNHGLYIINRGIGGAFYTEILIDKNLATPKNISKIIKFLSSFGNDIYQSNLDEKEYDLSYNFNINHESYRLINGSSCFFPYNDNTILNLSKESFVTTQSTCLDMNVNVENTFLLPFK